MDLFKRLEDEAEAERGRDGADAAARQLRRCTAERLRIPAPSGGQVQPEVEVK